MQDHELRGLLGDAYDECTDEQLRQVNALSDATERRWPGSDYTDERTDALNTGLEVILGDSEPEQIGREWADAVAAERLARRRLTGAIIALSAAGVSEYQIAERLGTSRPTVRKALTK